MSEYNPARLSTEMPEREARKFTERDKQEADSVREGIQIENYFCAVDEDPFDQVEWEMRTAEIKNPTTGETVFRQEGLEFPKTWSDNCTALVAEKYFRHVEFEHTNGVTTIQKRKETSVKQMISRVADTITQWGMKFGYFPSHPGSNGTTGWEVSIPARKFRNELVSILLHQRAAFNSPVWFNVGTKRGVAGTEQASACFIVSVEDTMKSILELAQKEGALYKGGSGSGVNYSPLRSSRESLSIGGTSSGPVPFIAKDDFNAGAIKSGGGTRRAAKMAILNADHGDIVEFIECKANSEKAAHALIDAGFDGDFRARWGAYQLVPFQNANHSVRVTDEFMQAVENDEDWDLLSRDGKTVLETLPARDIWKKICSAAWICGDPGLQFDTTTNNWHTSAASGRINSSNPCSEFVYLDNTACNLASINLLKYQEDGVLNVEAFQQTVDVLITAMEILVEGASYPTEEIAQNSHDFRPLGLGFTNLGAYFMTQGIAYDSAEARNQASFISSLMTARAYRQSAKIAEKMGPFSQYPFNREHMLKVIRMHEKSNDSVWDHQILSRNDKDAVIYDAAHKAWAEAEALGEIFGYRNAQATVIAPTGTISFMMDCDTTGIEPVLSLVSFKKLVGGGTIKLVNRRVGQALDELDYGPKAIEKIENYILENGSVVNAPGLREDHWKIFEGSFPDPVGGRSLRPEAHILMMAAVQPFISGAISKTCNLPSTATEEDISDIYMLAWKEGLKAIALYRDGCKRTQPLATKEEQEEKNEALEEFAQAMLTPVRKKLPSECLSIRHKFEIGQHEGYIHVGLYEDGIPGEIFIKMAKEGSTVSGLMDAWGIQTSLALQYGVPLKSVVQKFKHTSFEPSGWTREEGIGHASSVLDYVARWLEKKFVGGPLEIKTPQSPEIAVVEKEQSQSVSTGMACPDCGNTTVKAGTCATCPTCGWNQGCG